jgi:diguanylate cyclase (GGDEF)-like protein
LGRYGGEEFIVILPETNLEQTFVCGKRIVENIRNNTIFLDNATIQVTVSIGIAEINKDDTNLDNLLMRTDTALYKAKREGKNQASSS